MVYCGKPSKGCLACRSRKTRCDRQTPACSQCVRAKRECPGYRNQLDLMFRNESDSVIGKATSQKPRKKSTPSTSNPTPRSTTPSRKVSLSQSKASPRQRGPNSLFLSLLGDQVSVPETLSPSLEDRALSFYRNREAIWLRNFDIIESICRSGDTEEYLLASISAVGLASYAASVRSPKLMLRARKDYGQALKLCNEALRSPVKYTNDSTLFAVLALGVFEAVAGNGPESLDAWDKHLNGASELVKLRGINQLYNENGQRMFIQIASNLICQKITACEPMPEYIIEMRKASEMFVDTREPGWRISHELINFTNLRAKVTNEKNYDKRQVVERALEMDAVFADIADKRPRHWRGTIIRDDTTPEAIWDGYYTVYDDFWVAQMLNTMRVFRIHTLEILREQLHLDTDRAVFSSDEATALEGQAVGTMLEMQLQILASIPQYAPWGITSYPSSSPIEPWHVYQVLWPLYLAANMDITSMEVSQWALQRFQTMAKEGGIEHAAVFARSMMKRLRLEADGSSKEWMARPLKMDPFDWSGEGWAIVHGIILSAQVHKPKTPPSSPSSGGGASLPNLRTGSSTATSSTDSATASAAPSRASSIPPHIAAHIPQGWKGPPPPGWKPPPGFQMPPGAAHGQPSAMTSPSSSDSAASAIPSSATTDSRQGSFSSAIPPGWQGGPPPGWVPPPGFKMPPGPSQHSTKDNSQFAASNMPSHFQRGDIPPHVATQIPPGWKAAPPPGWHPGAQRTNPISNAGKNQQGMHQAPEAREVNAYSKSQASVVGLPSGGTMNSAKSDVAGNDITHNSTRPNKPPKFGPNGIPIGWKGPPPPGWKPPGMK